MTRRYRQKWPQLELEVREARALSTQPMFITTLRLYRKEKGALLIPIGALGWSTVMSYQRPQKACECVVMDCQFSTEAASVPASIRQF